MIAATTATFNASADRIQTAMLSIAADFATAIGATSSVYRDGDDMLPMPTDDDVTRASRQPVSMASVLSDLAAELGIELPAPIAAALVDNAEGVGYGPLPTPQA